MEIDLVMKEYEVALLKVMGGTNRVRVENDSFKLSVYRIGGTIRADLIEVKEKGE